MSKTEIALAATIDMNKPKHGLFLLTLEMAEKIYSVPVEDRQALLEQMARDSRAAFLGETDKTGPELATELIKKGVKAKSFVKGQPKAVIKEKP